MNAVKPIRTPMDPPDPIEAIKFRMEQKGLTRKDLARILGTRTRVSEVLNRRRNLSIGMIRQLHKKLGISRAGFASRSHRRGCEILPIICPVPAWGVDAVAHVDEFFQVVEEIEARCIQG